MATQNLTPLARFLVGLAFLLAVTLTHPEWVMAVIEWGSELSEGAETQTADTSVADTRPIENAIKAYEKRLVMGEAAAQEAVRIYEAAAVPLARIQAEYERRLRALQEQEAELAEEREAIAAAWEALHEEQATLERRAIELAEEAQALEAERVKLRETQIAVAQEQAVIDAREAAVIRRERRVMVMLAFCILLCLTTVGVVARGARSAKPAARRASRAYAETRPSVIPATLKPRDKRSRRS